MKNDGTFFFRSLYTIARLFPLSAVVRTNQITSFSVNTNNDFNKCVPGNVLFQTYTIFFTRSGTVYQKSTGRRDRDQQSSGKHVTQ